MSDELDFKELLKELVLRAALKKISGDDDEDSGKGSSKKQSGRYKELSKRAYKRACRYNVGDRVRIKRWQDIDKMRGIRKNNPVIPTLKEQMKLMSRDRRRELRIPPCDFVQGWRAPEGVGLNYYPSQFWILGGQVGTIVEKNEDFGRKTGRRYPPQYKVKFDNDFINQTEWDEDDNEPCWNFEEWMLEPAKKKDESPAFYGERVKPGTIVRVKTAEEMAADKTLWGPNEEEISRPRDAMLAMSRAWVSTEDPSGLCISQEALDIVGGKNAVVKKWGGMREGYILEFFDEKAQDEADDHIWYEWMFNQVGDYKVMNGGVADTEDHNYAKTAEAEAGCYGGADSGDGREDASEDDNPAAQARKSGAPYLRIVKGGEDDE